MLSSSKGRSLFKNNYNKLHPAQEKYKITPIDHMSALCPS